jgi:hypothetical protein
MSKIHPMKVVARDASGVTFYCETCGHKVFWPTGENQLEVLVMGDPTAEHSAGYGGIEMTVNIEQAPDVDREEPFRNFMEECDGL